MSPFLQLLAIIALTLYVLWTYLIPPFTEPPSAPYARRLISALVILVIVIFWYFTPVLK